MRRTFCFLFLLFCAVWGQAQQAKPPAAAAAKPPAAAEAKPAREPGLYATINTSMGPIVIKLYEQESPITVKNFADLARGLKSFQDYKTGQFVKRPFYNGLTFHRVMPNFMIQGGDPTATGAGTGGIKPIPDEFHPSLKFDQPGRLGMANAGLGTGTTQFFITEVPTPHLNGLHTIFGQVVEGQELVGKIARVPANNTKPITPVRMVSVIIKREGSPPPGEVKPPVKKAAAPAAKKAAPAAPKAATPAPVKK